MSMDSHSKVWSKLSRPLLNSIMIKTVWIWRIIQIDINWFSNYMIQGIILVIFLYCNHLIIMHIQLLIIGHIVKFSGLQSFRTVAWV